MPTISTKDGARIDYKDWRAGQPVVFSHGWPLTADAWQDQMFFLADRGFRCNARDRRGHGRSSQPWNRNEMDTYADDLRALTKAVDLKGAIHVDHSTGSGEVARYVGRHGTKGAAKAVLIGAVPPRMLNMPANPGGLPMGAFGTNRAILHGDDGESVPITNSALLSAKLVKGPSLKVIPGAPHGMCSTRKDQIKAGLLAFFRSAHQASA